MHKLFTGYRTTNYLRLYFLFLLAHSSFFASAQFHDYNGAIRTLNYYMLHMEHLLINQEQTTYFIKDISVALTPNDAIAVQQAANANARQLNLQEYHAYLVKANEGLADNYNVKTFIRYHQKSKYLPDSLNKAFKKWIQKADSIAVVQNTIANDMMKLLARYNLAFGDKQADFKNIHTLIKQYHNNLSDLQIIRDDITSTALEYYHRLENKKKYPFAVYKKACEYFLRIAIHINNYFEYTDAENEEVAVAELRKLNDEIQGYLTNEYTYRRYNNELPGFHVFPLEEDAHNDISYSFKEVSFEITQYINSGRTEKVDSVFFRKKMKDVMDLLYAISFSHDMNVNVQNSKDVPDSYHVPLKAILRYDFLRPRYDLYHNAGGNSTTSAMPLAWCRYVFSFTYTEPKDSSFTILVPEIKPADAPVIEKERETIIVQTIKIDTDSVTLSFYDNAEIDNDTITILVNGTVSAENIELALKPYELVLKFDTLNKVKLVSLFANNLGKIPPNTAYLKVTAGDRVYRMYLFSTKKVNAAIKIIYQKEVALESIE